MEISISEDECRFVFPRLPSSLSSVLDANVSGTTLAAGEGEDNRRLAPNGTYFRNPQRQQGSVAPPKHAESLAHAFRSCAVLVLLADNPKGSQQLAGG